MRKNYVIELQKEQMVELEDLYYFTLKEPIEFTKFLENYCDAELKARLSLELQDRNYSIFQRRIDRFADTGIVTFNYEIIIPQAINIQIKEIN